jgi:hypothetical protein
MTQFAAIHVFSYTERHCESRHRGRYHHGQKCLTSSTAQSGLG